VRVVEHWNRSLRSCGVSTLGDTKNLIRGCAGQPALADPASAQGWTG